MMTSSSADRIAACFAGIAVGDAVGKQTEMLSYDEVSGWYPYGLRGFEGTPGAIIPRYSGNSKREWRIGETTDDTERTIAVATAIIADRAVSHVSVGREMPSSRKVLHGRFFTEGSSQKVLHVSNEPLEKNLWRRTSGEEPLVKNPS